MPHAKCHEQNYAALKHVDQICSERLLSEQVRIQLYGPLLRRPVVLSTHRHILVVDATGVVQITKLYVEFTVKKDILHFDIHVSQFLTV